MKHLKDIVTESFFDIDGQSDTFDTTIKKEEIKDFLKKCEKQCATKDFINTFKLWVKEYDLSKYKTFGWKPGRKCIVFNDKYAEFYIGDAYVEGKTYCVSCIGIGEEWQNITTYVGTSFWQGKLYQLRDENEFFFDAVIEYIKNNSK